ncbi:unnamed protein product, partial [Amoebophrya sp. A120]
RSQQRQRLPVDPRRPKVLQKPTQGPEAFLLRCSPAGFLGKTDPLFRFTMINNSVMNFIKAASKWR